MENIQLFGYGRAVPGREWYINPTRWANRIYYIYSGTGYVRLGETAEYRLQPQTLYLISDRLSFKARQEMEAPVDHLFVDFHIAPGFDLWEPLAFPAEQYPALRQAIAPLEVLAAERRPGDEQLAEEVVRSILRFIHRERPIPRPQDTRVTRAMQLLYETQDRSLTVRQLADAVHLDEDYFIRLFRRVVGISPYRYIRAQRLNRGIALLQSGATVAEAALQTGYGDTAAFSKAIRQFTGRPPTSL